MVNILCQIPSVDKVLKHLELDTTDIADGIKGNAELCKLL